MRNWKRKYEEQKPVEFLIFVKGWIESASIIKGNENLFFISYNWF